MTLSNKGKIFQLILILFAVVSMLQVLWPSGLQAWQLSPFSGLIHGHMDTSMPLYDVKSNPSVERSQVLDSTTISESSIDPLSSVVSLEGRTLLFSDEFDGSSLDSSKWNPYYWWRDDEFGCTIAPNNELQWYQPDDVLVGGGIMRLRAQERTVVNCDGQTYNYTAGIVTSGKECWDAPEPDKFAFQYGYAEARLKMPLGQGLWPAFWLLSCDQEWPPEIDIMEFLGHKPEITHMTLHYLNDNGEYDESGDWWVSPHDFSADWHTFGLDWRPDAMIWYVDGIERWRFTDANIIPSEPMYMVLNLAVGGDWPGAPDESTQFPNYFDVDYVKVWSPRVINIDSLTEQVALPMIFKGRS